MNRRLFLAGLFLVGACASPTRPAALSLKVVANDDAVQLLNQSDRDTFYFIYERAAAALIDWAPCVDPSRCAFVAPGAQVAVPYAAIGGYAPGKTEAIVWWWHAGPGPADAPVPGTIHSVVVGL